MLITVTIIENYNNADCKTITCIVDSAESTAYLLLHLFSPHLNKLRNNKDTKYFPFIAKVSCDGIPYGKQNYMIERYIDLGIVNASWDKFNEKYNIPEGE